MTMQSSPISEATELSSTVLAYRIDLSAPSSSLALPGRAKRRRDSNSAEPEGKRRKTVRPAAGRKRATLRIDAIQELPLELIFEILYYLQPYDLLRLARTTRGFRSLLMSKTSAFLWRTARGNVDPKLPDLPFDLTEPAYAHLVFHSYCTFCHIRCEKIMWECRVRCCKKCLKVKFIPNDLQTRAQYYTLLEKHQMVSAVPKSTLNLSHHLYVKALDELSAELFELDLNGDNEAIQHWNDYKKAQYNTIKNHALECSSWVNMRKFIQKEEQRAAQQQRVQWIIERATAEGWGREIICLYRVRRQFSNHPSIKKKERPALTDLDWLKIKPLITIPLQAERTRIFSLAMYRRLRLLQDAFKTFCATRSMQNMIFPSLGDIVTARGPIRHLLETTPLDRSGLELDGTEFLEFIEKWQDQKEMELFTMLCEAVPGTSELGDLCLATTVFKCNASKCGATLYYPEVFQHACATAYNFTSQESSSTHPNTDFTQQGHDLSKLGPSSTLDAPSSSSSAVHVSDEEGLLVVEGMTFDCCKILQVRPWNHGGKRISFDHRASGIVRQILDADSYLDPTKTTIQQIRAWNPTIRCNLCSHNLFCWPELFQHDNDVQVEGHEYVFDWSTPSPYGNFNVVYGLESWVYGSRCKFCNQLLHPKMLAGHLVSQHNETKIDGNWYMDLSSRIPV